MAATPRFYTQDEIAQIFQISVRTVQDRVASGRWPCTRFGPRLVRFSLADFDEIARRAHLDPTEELPAPVPRPDRTVRVVELGPGHRRRPNTRVVRSFPTAEPAQQERSG